MLDYTKLAIKQTLNSIKRADYIRNILTQLIYISYLIYTLVVKVGVFAANVVLLSISVIYLIFFLIISSIERKVEKKVDEKNLQVVKYFGRNLFKWTRRVIRLFVLGVTIYGITNTVKAPSALSIIFIALMIVGFILQIIFEVIIKSVADRVSLIVEGLEADMDGLLKPAKAVGNFFKKITGKEVPPKKEPTKNQLKLKKMLDDLRAERKAAKQKAKLQRSEEKQRRKDEKRAEKFQDDPNPTVDAKGDFQSDETNLPPENVGLIVTEQPSENIAEAIPEPAAKNEEAKDGKIVRKLKNWLELIKKHEQDEVGRDEFATDEENIGKESKDGKEDKASEIAATQDKRKEK